MKGKTMGELVKWEGLKTFLDRRLIRALDHPVREHILAELNERIASAREIGADLEADVSAFYHHVEELERLGCIERVQTRRRRGAKEHFFRAKRTLFFDDEAWRKLPATVRADLATSFLQALFDDVANALEHGTLVASAATHVNWIPGQFDSQGWDEATDLLGETVRKLIDIQRHSSLRLLDSDEKPISATVGILGFERPDGASSS